MLGLDCADREAAAVAKRLRKIVILCMVLVAVTLSVYVQTRNHDFLSYDDWKYVTENPHVAGGISGSNIAWAFTSVHASNWHPITWLSHMADVKLHGLNPGGHHLTNVVIHSLSSLILLLLLIRLTSALWKSFFVAALFALHPLHVESVAWIAERKDVISTFFCFITLFFYSEYAAKRRMGLYLLTLVFFMLGLMSKPMLVSLPLVMLLMDWWPLGRYHNENREEGLRKNWGRLTALTMEKAPFFLLVLLSSTITMYAQMKGGAVGMIPLGLRIQNALCAYVKYICKIFWPSPCKPRKIVS